MSDNFADTTNYANSLNSLRTPGSQQQQAIAPNRQYQNVQPNIHPAPLAPIASKPPVKGAASIAPTTLSSKKRAASTTPVGPVQRKKSASRKQILDSTSSAPPVISPVANIVSTTENTSSSVHDDSKLDTLANIAATTQKPPIQQQAGHRPVTSCTHCRQHKIKCNASERFPAPCHRCEKMGLNCEIDPQFRPRKGSQIQSLRNDVDELKLKIEYLQRNESLIAQALAKTNHPQQHPGFIKNEHAPHISSPLNSPPTSVKTILRKEPHLLMDRRESSSVSRQSDSPGSLPQLLNDSAPTNSDHSKDLPHFLEMSVRGATPSHDDNPSHSPLSNHSAASNSVISEFVLGDVYLPLNKANQLHDRFITNYLPYFPAMSSKNSSELYAQSQLLFWVVCLTACLSDPDPTLYNKLASLIKQLAIETCWIRTPRSTHISQALLILCIWPLPNQKVLDDCSYRFVGLAKSLGYQLGLHRGKFISEFSRTQVALPDAEKWRTRTWLGIFFAEQFWASNLGLPPSLQTDYLIENARIDKNLPKNFRSLISLSIFQAKLVNVMGSSVTSPDGLMEARNRAGSLSILERELERLIYKLEIDDSNVEIYYLYVKLTICCFAFLPETPPEDQTKYVTQAYMAATRIVTLVSKILESKNLIELPIYIRQSVTYSALILFKLHLTPLLLERYIDSSRQSIVTVHRLFRNQLSAWKNVENDISRTAQVLEKLNYVLFTNPELFTNGDGIITRMRSHLTGSLFYDLVWCIHEARRKNLEDQKQGRVPGERVQYSMDKRRPVPLPFYNQINKDDFQTITTTTPGGTTITTLVPTENAMSKATASATAAGLSKPTEIEGIPLNMLDSTGSIPADSLPINDDIRRLLPKTSSIKGAPFQQESNIRGSKPAANNPAHAPINVENFESVSSPNSHNFSTASFDNLANNEALTQADFDTFFQKQNAGWVEDNDDFLGWFDMNMAPEF